MTLRRPMITVSSTEIREAPNAEWETMHRKIAYHYAQDPSVALSVVGSGGNISPSMSDTRFRSGAAKRNTTGNFPEVTTFPTNAQTPAAASFTVNTYDKVSQTLTNTGSIPSYTVKPVYATGGDIIREMSFTDCIDTFINPVIDNIISGTTSSLAGGAYFISTSTSISGSTDLGVIFTDTTTNQSGYAASSIGTANTFQDPVGSTTNYRLYRNNGDSTTPNLPLVIDYTSNGVNNPAGLREMTQTEFENFFGQLIRNYAFDQAGYRIRYNFNGNGTTKGSAITNTGLTGVTSTYNTFKASANDYRAQEFPSGTLSVLQTHRLKVEKT